MPELVPRNQRESDRSIGSWRDRRWVAEVRLRAQLAEFEEVSEANRLDTRLSAADRLARNEGARLVFMRHDFTQLAGGDPALELDLRDLERVVKLGAEHVIYDYLNRR